MSRERREKESTPERSGSLMFLAIAAVLLLLALYFLSIGPVVWLGHHGYIDVDSSMVGLAYIPIIWLENNCEPFRRVLTAYADLFR